MDKKYVAYVGSYTHESSKGIHIYDCDVAKGRITERGEVAIDNPSFITFSPDKNFLYAICDQGVSAYAILADGNIELMNVASINGMQTALLDLLQMKYSTRESAVLPKEIFVHI